MSPDGLSDISTPSPPRDPGPSKRCGSGDLPAGSNRGVRVATVAADMRHRAVFSVLTLRHSRAGKGNEQRANGE
jgi:hypothetical protein